MNRRMSEGSVRSVAIPVPPIACTGLLDRIEGFAAIHSLARKTQGAYGVGAMARIPRIVLIAAIPFSLSPAVSLAQDENARSDAVQASQPQAIDPAQGIPDDFTLPPGPTATPRNRLEPMVQPLPQPSASPTSAPTPTREAPQPTSTPVPRQTTPRRTTPSQTTPGRTVPERTTEPVTSAAAPRAEPIPQAEPIVPGGQPASPITEQSVAPATPATRLQPETVRPTTTNLADTREGETSRSGWDFLAWLLGGIAVLALGGLAFWWLRHRKEESFSVEKIEPYRPSPKPDGVEDSPRVEEIPQAHPSEKTLAGLVNVDRPVPAPNPGGFVTSSIATRRMSLPGTSQHNANPQASQTQSRNNMSTDGRIVTTLPSLRTRRD